MNYDIIGDIHGHANKLEGLLKKLGYAETAGSYRRSDHQAVFVGDFIDRGTNNTRVIGIVRNMIEADQAHAVMGNHEYNAICYHTNHPETGQPLRPHSDKNQQQHQSTLDEFPHGSDNAKSMINWFKTLPVYLEFDGFRVIHACWDQTSLQTFKPQLATDQTLSDELIIQSANEHSREFHAIETLLKGPEIPLPDGIVFYDKDNNQRDNVRIKWWDDTANNYRSIAVGPEKDVAMIPNHPIPTDTIRPTYPKDAPVVFVGHYWRTRTQDALLSHNVACVDFSVGKGGPLTAYRWVKGDVALDAEKLVRI